MSHSTCLPAALRTHVWRIPADRHQPFQSLRSSAHMRRRSSAVQAEGSAAGISAAVASAPALSAGSWCGHGVGIWKRHAAAGGPQRTGGPTGQGLAHHCGCHHRCRHAQRRAVAGSAATCWQCSHPISPLTGNCYTNALCAAEQSRWIDEQLGNITKSRVYVVEHDADRLQLCRREAVLARVMAATDERASYLPELSCIDQRSC